MYGYKKEGMWKSQIRIDYKEKTNSYKSGIQW